ncbi:lipopolysaccharide kinase InaA family protein [Flavobacterium sp. CBA20B-1]|uniref:lipopolysaccharide kinase InaA family protein n=1 Tax=unclassified Flavobacterium TaxID=196869 RepID=UPI002224CB96|nr:MULTISPECIES: lipopolysaccharide kinase InaA family protein [unclassified Flavobacterium]WCM43020.1 lipopolysaccharide kinase InaA family protein [Flavobacterium sp. CBA20B-1]
MKFTVHQIFKRYKAEIGKIIENFEITGDLFVKGSRNTIKTFQLSDLVLNIKAFKKPNLLNAFVYRFIRASKANRSYEYALKLLDKNIGTPQPIAFAEEHLGLGLGKSFYVCEHIVTEYTYRDLVQNPSLENHEEILRAFTRFCYQLHQAGVEFKDHSPGNTLIKINDDQTYSFYLVDLNRMRFHSELPFEQRMYNLRRLTPKMDMIAVMANEYAKLYTQKTETEIFELLWELTSGFQEKFHRKQRLKKRIKFWKK